jgi:ABC-2 type transport system ATP-binding protein
MELYDRRNDLVKKFSGGMRRRLEIARGFLHRPRILFLDEPTIGLDPQTRFHIWSYIRSLNDNERVTVFLTTHQMEEAERMADRVAIIDHGKLVTMGTVDEIKGQTNSATLEDAFLALTGQEMRDRGVGAAEQMRSQMRFRH